MGQGRQGIGRPRGLSKRRILFFLACALVLPAVAGAAPYPERPVRLIVGFPPGGAADILGRLAAQRLGDALGQQVVVDNRGGAGGLIATEIAKSGAPDGYTLLFSSIPHVINPHLYRKVNYDAIRDFVPVIQFVSVPLMMAAAPNFSPRSIKELLALAKAKPDQINYASAGAGSSSHLAMELFKTMGDVRMTHIPYKGTGPLITDLVSGQVSITIASAVPLSPQVRAGRLRGLGVTSPKRSAAFPELPAIAETLPGYEVVNWFGIFAPAGTPHAIVTRINGALDDALKSPQLVKTLNSTGADAIGGTPGAFAKVVAQDYAKWAKVVKESGARVD
jgi:tripartite-type tricarboxylate transporter receptor subunit TctC